jgi:hypothetical protein
LSPIREDIIFNENKNISLSEIKNKVSEDYGFISMVIKIDLSMLNKLLKNFVLELNEMNILSKLKTLNQLKKGKYFEIFPEIPPITDFKESNSLLFIKKVLPIIIDLHRF